MRLQPLGKCARCDDLRARLTAPQPACFRFRVSVDVEAALHARHAHPELAQSPSRRIRP